eukprot:SAG11_NODE_2019_length_3914_cov_2.546908_1_plen_94_part_00
MAVANIIWCSLDPVNCRIDVYPQAKANMIEEAYNRFLPEVFLVRRQLRRPSSPDIAQPLHNVLLQLSICPQNSSRVECAPSTAMVHNCQCERK